MSTMQRKTRKAREMTVLNPIACAYRPSGFGLENGTWSIEGDSKEDSAG